jgi:hypothetical protein
MGRLLGRACRLSIWSVLAFASTAPLDAASGVIYDSGPLATELRDACGDADSSRIQNLSFPDLSVIYSSCDIGEGFRQADDFVLASSTLVNSITVYALEAGSTESCTIEDVRLQIWNGPPDAGGQVIFGDTATDRFAACQFSGIYRGVESYPTPCSSPIMAVTATVNQTLDAGTYWADFQLGGTLEQGVGCVSATKVGDPEPCTGGCNGKRFFGVWSDWESG